MLAARESKIRHLQLVVAVARPAPLACKACARVFITHEASLRMPHLQLPALASAPDGRPPRITNRRFARRRATWQSAPRWRRSS